MNEKKVVAHEHAKNMKLYAEDAMTSSKPYKNWQYYNREQERWVDCVAHPEWHTNTDYRKRPYKNWQYYNREQERWVDCVAHPEWHTNTDYRKKPTIEPFTIIEGNLWLEGVEMIQLENDQASIDSVLLFINSYDPQLIEPVACRDQDAIKEGVMVGIPAKLAKFGDYILKHPLFGLKVLSRDEFRQVCSNFHCRFKKIDPQQFIEGDENV